MSLWNALGAVDKALKALSITERVVTLTESQAQPDSAPADLEEEKVMSEDNEKQTIFEEIEVEGRHLVDRVRELLREGNVRTLRIKDGKGRYLLEIPLTVGVVAGGVMLMAAPTLAALSALAGLVTNVKIEVVRVDDTDGEESPTPRTTRKLFSG